MLPLLIVVSFVLACIPALLFRANLHAYTHAPLLRSICHRSSVSLLIPARDEASSIESVVRAALASLDVDFEVIVLDDHSSDETAAIVSKLARQDRRVRLIQGPELPQGWSGKQHACWILSHEARHPLLIFLDADVRLTPDALARMISFLEVSGADLVSGIPRQVTGSWMERLVIPLIHFVLLGFLPIERMRRSPHPSFSAGCGQLFLARRTAYERSGGHSKIRDTFHDGLRLPRSFRRAGFKTDLFDATDLASCRMYRNATEVWSGLSKNAHEALAAPAMIVPMTLILLLGQVLPPFLVVVAFFSRPGAERLANLTLASVATVACYYPRLAAGLRFRQSMAGVVLHPFGVLLLIAIQWYAFTRHCLGLPATWKGRPYVGGASSNRDVEPHQGPRQPSPGHGSAIT